MTYIGINSINCINQALRQYECDNCGEYFDVLDEDYFISYPVGGVYGDNEATKKENAEYNNNGYSASTISEGFPTIKCEDGSDYYYEITENVAFDSGD